LVLLHGLLGSGDNLGTVARELSSDHDVLVIDQRDHGRSPHTDRITYPLMAEDVHALLSGLGVKDITVVGHSMGGKTAMVLTQQHPELVKRLVVIDIGPREYPYSNHDHIIEALLACDLSAMQSRQDVEQHMARYVKEPGVVQFIMKSLYWKEEDVLAWRFNVPVIARDMPDILAGIGPETVRTPTLFIRGGQSDYIVREDLPAIKEQFPNSRVETIEYAGHWVHAQAPEEVVKLIREFR
jgi:pimeloyl-ACP methyl ester carboxylesterase